MRSIGIEGHGPGYLLSNDEGDFAFVSASEHAIIRERSYDARAPRFAELITRGLIDAPRSSGLRSLEIAARRTRKSFLLEGPTLHIFVVTLRCDHACHYCQVSRASLHASGFDMARETADAAVDRVFESPGEALTVEFQGGEPGLRFDLVRYIVNALEVRNQSEGKSFRFSLVSTLHHLTDADLEFCRDHGIHISTSIDGPDDLHDGQRPLPGKSSSAATTVALVRARSILGHGGVAALCTITRAALNRPREVVDAYRQHGFANIFLRPISPYGFALKTRKAIGYEVSEFLAFYEHALDYILELNRQGEEMVEVYASILLRHILTPFGSGYVDLRSPAGAGLGVLVYDYDGQVYPADEARMAARTGDRRFRLGPVHEPLETLLASDAMRWLARGSIAEELPGCRDCAFVPFCGADPVYHAAAQGDPAGDRSTSDFCRKHLGLFQLLFRKLRDADPETMRTFQAWAFQRPRAEIVEAGHVEQ